MCTKMHDFLCKISSFPGVTPTEHPPASTANTRGSSPRPGRRPSARHPNVEHKSAPMRSTIGASFHRRHPSISGCCPSALEHFTVPGDVGAIHGNLLRRRRLKTYLSRSRTLANTCTDLCFTALQFYSVYYSGPCSILARSLFEILFDWLND